MENYLLLIIPYIRNKRPGKARPSIQFNKPYSLVIKWKQSNAIIVISPPRNSFFQAIAKPNSVLIGKQIKARISELLVNPWLRLSSSPKRCAPIMNNRNPMLNREPIRAIHNSVVWNWFLLIANPFLFIISNRKRWGNQNIET